MEYCEQRDGATAIDKKPTYGILIVSNIDRLKALGNSSSIAHWVFQLCDSLRKCLGPEESAYLCMSGV
jgi:hypothetical protein